MTLINKTMEAQDRVTSPGWHGHKVPSSEKFVLKTIVGWARIMVIRPWSLPQSDEAQEGGDWDRGDRGRKP